MTASIAAVQIMAIDDPARPTVRLLGMAGFGDAPEFVERLSACRRLGAPGPVPRGLPDREARGRPAPQAGDHGRPGVGAAARDHGPARLGQLRGDAAGRCAAGPLGVMNAYYAPGDDPGEASLAFLEAMADHAAVADRHRGAARPDPLAGPAGRAPPARPRPARLRGAAAVLDAHAGHRRCARSSTGRRGLRRVRDAAEELAALARSALADLRGLVFELRPLDLAERGLVDAVRAHAAGLRGAHRARRRAVDAPPDLEPTCGIDVQEDLYRIVQEALHNVVKHAQATAVDVRFARDATRLVVEVTDDGRGRHRRGARAGTAGAGVDARTRAAVGRPARRGAGPDRGGVGGARHGSRKGLR